MKPYPAAKDKDLSEYESEVVEIISTATFTKPE
jgi:hypothetical protein